MDPTYDVNDVLIGMSAAFIMGSGVSAFRTRNMRVASEVDNHMRTLELDQIEEAGGELSEAGRQYYRRPLEARVAAKTDEERLNAIYEDGENRGTEFANARADRAAINLSSDLPEVRGLSSAFFGDPLGGKKGELANEKATIWKRLQSGRMKTKFYKGFEKNFKGFLAGEGKLSLFQSFRSKERTQFNEAVTRYIRGEATDNVHVKAQGDLLRDMYKKVLEMAKKPQGDEALPNAVPVRGSDEVEFNQLYSPRQWSAGKIQQQIVRTGYSQVQRTIATAFTNVDGEAAMQLAGAFMEIISKGKKDTVSLPQLNKMVNDDISAQLISDLGIEASQAAKIASQIQKAIKRKDGSKTKHLKNRVEMNEKLIEDFLENDSEILFNNYLNTMMGHISLARHGIDSEATFKKAIGHIEGKRAVRRASGKIDRAKQDLEIKNLRDAYDHLIGRPVDSDPGSIGAQTGRIVRKINVSRFMNQLGFAQLNELSNAVNHLGWSVLISHVPLYKKMLAKLSNKEYRDELQEELSDAYGGWANGRLLHQVSNQADDFGSAFSGQKNMADKVERGLDHANKWTANISGFHTVTNMLHNMVMKRTSQKFLDYAMKGKAVTSEARLLELGIDGPFLQRIKEQMTQHVTHKNGKLTRMNFDKWDSEVFAKYSYSMRSWGERIIQEQDFGDGIPWLSTSELGKTLVQFRTFTLTAYPKQLLHSFKHADAQMFSKYITAMFFAGLSYNIQTHAQALGRHDREEYLKRRLSTEAMVKAAFQRSTYGSIAPMLIDTAAHPFTDKPIFGYRSSGLGADPLTGGAWFDLANRSWQTLGMFGDGQVSDKDWGNFYRTLLFSNVLGLNQMLINFGTNFPEENYYK